LWLGASFLPGTRTLCTDLCIGCTRREHLPALDGAGLADGVYVVRVQTGDEVAERRVTLAQ
jgi:hypothetical protein